MGLSKLIWLFGAVALLVSAPVGADDRLNGRYVGIQDAEGAAIVIAPSGSGFTGTFYDPHGKRQNFQADNIGGAAEAVLDMDNRTVLMRMTPLPFGAEVALVPFSANGQLIIQDGRIVSFVREGLDVPEPPADFVPPPVDASGRIAAYSFLASYEFWSPTGVRDGYLALNTKSRTLIRLFPAVQLDIIWKLCLAPGAEEALGIALRGEGVNCEEVIDGVASAQRSGRFDRYKAEVQSQGETLRTAVRCGDGYVADKRTCDAAAKQVSQAAVALETAGTVLRRYR